MDAAPSVVLEVAVFNESETELLNEGSEWLDVPDVQVGPLMTRLKQSTALLPLVETLPLLSMKTSHHCSA